jgi:aspartyl-tRNA(Asn)/glutamyl-tRNA(Gln) amidotransferase subunit A
MSSAPPLENGTISDAAALLRARAVSPEDLLHACAARIDQLNPVLRAFISRRDDEALVTARSAASALTSSNPVSLLAGIPLAHKDMFFRAGEQVTFGAHPGRSQRPTFTATVKARLDRHLAPDLGGLNMSEYAAGPTGANPHHGRCANPWAFDRLSGGSSSGSAAAVAARMVFGSLGSDTGGSIRIPAAFCGVTGLKPTFGRVSRHGVMPRVWSQDSVGPIARSADDCATMLAAIAGPDGMDPLVVAAAPAFVWPGRPLGSVARIGVLEVKEHADRDVERCMEAAIDDLRRLGHRVGIAHWSKMQDVLTLAEVMHKAEATAIHDVWLRDRPEEYGDFVRERFEEGLAISAVRYLQAQSLRLPMAQDFVNNALRDFDVLLLPTVGCQAPRASEADEDSEASRRILRKLTQFTRPFSYLGLPALSVPCGFGDAQMPVGLQVVGRPFAETTVLTIGHLYQQETDWHRQHPSLDGIGLQAATE